LLIIIPHFKPARISSSGHSKEDQESLIVRQFQAFVKLSDVLLMSEEPGKSRLCQMGFDGQLSIFPNFPRITGRKSGLGAF